MADKEDKKEDKDIVECIQGHKNKLGDNFCRTCGERISGGKIICPHCGATLDSGSKFCGKCGKSVTAARKEEAANLQGMRWQRGIDDFATRVEVEDLKGTLQKGLIIEQGTKALLFVNGALAETLQPGMYDLGGLASKLRNFEPFRTSTAILIDSGDVELNLNITGIYTKDPLNIDITCKVIAQIENPTFFFNNVMKGRKSYLLSELRGTLYDEMQNAFNEIIGKKSVTELNWDLALKRQFEVSVENHLRTTFQRNGLNFIQLRTIDYMFKRFDKVRGIHEEAFLMISEDEAELQKRKRLFDVYNQTQLQDIFEETKEVEYREKRQKVWADMRALVNSDKMNEIKSADDLEAYLHEINKGKYLREDEVQELLNTFEQSGRNRKFLLDKIDLEHKIELQKLQLVGAEERRENEELLKRQRDTINFQKERASVEREVKFEDAKSDASIKDLEREGDQKDLDMGLTALERIKKMKADQKREEMNIETERLERLSKLGIEALITASDKDQAEMLKDLKKTEILKGMTEEQILAMGAAHSNELAKAFQEKFKGLSAEKQEELYKEMMKQKDISMKTMQEMFDKALETQRDATVGVAQGGKVVYPPYGPGPMGGGPGGTGFYNVSMEAGGGGGQKVIICSKCKSEVKTGEKFCPNCGNQMF
jgi:RNA polymerase subunit RPABC4/transcription elongation factor Spt4